MERPSNLTEAQTVILDFLDLLTERIDKLLRKIDVAMENGYPIEAKVYVETAKAMVDLRKDIVNKYAVTTVMDVNDGSKLGSS